MSSSRCHSFWRNDPTQPFLAGSPGVILFGAMRILPPSSNLACLAPGFLLGAAFAPPFGKPLGIIHISGITPNLHSFWSFMRSQIPDFHPTVRQRRPRHPPDTISSLLHPKPRYPTRSPIPIAIPNQSIKRKHAPNRTPSTLDNTTTDENKLETSEYLYHLPMDPSKTKPPVVGCRRRGLARGGPDVLRHLPHPARSA